MVSQRMKHRLLLELDLQLSSHFSIVAVLTLRPRISFHDWYSLAHELPSHMVTSVSLSTPTGLPRSTQHIVFLTPCHFVPSIHPLALIGVSNVSPFNRSPWVSPQQAPQVPRWVSFASLSQLLCLVPSLEDFVGIG